MNDTKQKRKISRGRKKMQSIEQKRRTQIIIEEQCACALISAFRLSFLEFLVWLSLLSVYFSLDRCIEIIQLIRIRNSCECRDWIDFVLKTKPKRIQRFFDWNLEIIELISHSLRWWNFVSALNYRDKFTKQKHDKWAYESASILCCHLPLFFSSKKKSGAKKNELRSVAMQ